MPFSATSIMYWRKVRRYSMPFIHSCTPCTVVQRVWIWLCDGLHCLLLSACMGIKIHAVQDAYVTTVPPCFLHFIFQYFIGTFLSIFFSLSRREHILIDPGLSLKQYALPQTTGEKSKREYSKRASNRNWHIL